MTRHSVKEWPIEVFDLNFSNIDTANSECAKALREHLTPDVFELLEQLGDQCTRHGVASTIREVNQQIGPRNVSLLPRLQLDWSLRDGTVRFGDSTTIVTQGMNTCALDVLTFLGWGLQLGSQRRDVEPLGSWTALPKPAVMYRTLMARIRLPHIDPTAKNALRDATMDALSEWDSRAHEFHGLQGIQAVADLCWKGLRSLSYTTMDLIQCCNNYIVPPAARSIRRMGHSIFLHRGDKDMYPGKSLVEIIQDTFLHIAPSHRDSSGDMEAPFAACKGNESSCLQLSTQRRVIVDAPPAIFYVSLGAGYPTENSTCRKWDSDLTLEVFRWQDGRTIAITWKVVGMAFHYGGNGIRHFVGQVFRPADMKGFKKKSIFHFDGGELSGIDKFTTGLQTDRNAHVVLVLYRMTDESVQRWAK